MARSFPRQGYDPTTGEWNDSLRGVFLWSNVNVSEAVPDVMTPSTWSLWWIYHYEASPFEFPGTVPFCGNICGRPYLNLSLLVSVYEAIGRDARQELHGDIIGSTPPDLDIPTIPLPRWAVVRALLPGLLAARWRARQDKGQVAVYVASMPAWCRETDQAIAACRTPPDLLAVWRQRIRPMTVRSCRMLRGVTMALADPATKLHLLLASLVGESDANALLSGISGASADLASLGPLVGLARVRDGRMSPADYMERYGHRGPHEMELSAPGSEDDPRWLELRLAGLGDSVGSVDVRLDRQRAESQAAWARFEARYAHRASTARRELEKVAAAARDREAVRSEVTRLARLVRRYLLHAGRLLSLGDAVFFLSLDEAAEQLEGRPESTARIPARRETYCRQADLPAYPPLIVGAFDAPRWAADPDRRNDCFDSRRPVTATTGTLKGFGASAGCVEGVVRRIDRVEDGGQIQPGEILVTVTTNVGWTPLFPRLAAIVTDVGAPLSHAAIVAREMGIPAVVGCGNATTLLKTGDRVRIDGAKGGIEILA